MGIRHGIAILILLTVGTLAPGMASACSMDDVAKIIKNFGSVDPYMMGRDETVDCLVEHGSDSAKLLIAELHPVPEKLITLEHQAYPKHWPTLRVIWCVRMLRAMTGLNFMAGSAEEIRKQNLPGARGDWITLNSGDSVRMFSNTMSHDSLYIAPPDIQAAVIEKWKQWYAKDGASFKYKADHNLDDWYF